IAQVWISFHRLHKYLVESGSWRYVFSIPGGWFRRLHDHLDHDCFRGLTVKQRSGGQHLKEYDSQRIDIGTRIRRTVSQPLRGKELRSADNPTGGCEASLRALCQVRKTKIHYLHPVLSLTTVLEDDIFRLQVPVNYALAVSLFQSPAYLNHDLGNGC